MTSDEGLYLFTVSGDTTITITIAEGTGVEYESVRSIDLNPQAEGNTFDKSSSYTTTWTASNSQASYEISSMNNNKNGWTVIKAGRESKDATAYISTKSAITEAVSYVSITVDAIGDVSKVTSFKLIIADNSSFTDATEISLTIFAGENIFEIDNPQAGMYYKIELITQPTGKNGAFVFSHLEFFAEK